MGTVYIVHNFLFIFNLIFSSDCTGDESAFVCVGASSRETDDDSPHSPDIAFDMELSM